MRVRVTVYYGDEGTPLSRETKSYELVTRDEDEETFREALDYITEAVLKPYQADGHDFEDDEEEEDAIGTDYLAAWILPDWFDDRAEASDFLKQVTKDSSRALADIE